MSGHSKWHKLKNKKGKTDSARANLFTKLCRNITVAAQQGGGDPEMNFSLRLAVEKARAGNVPKDNIDRAIKRGTGELSDGTVLETILYEGFGPHGTAFLVEAVTDNKNRTVSELKHAFQEHGGSLGGPGSVQWQFMHRGVIRLGAEDVAKIPDIDTFQLSVIDAGAEDILSTSHGLEIRTALDRFQQVLEFVKKAQYEPETAALEWVAKDILSVSDEDHEKVASLAEVLDELDDVKEVYTNT